MEPIVSITIPPRGSGNVRHLAPKVQGARWSESVEGSQEAQFEVLDPVAAAALTQDCKVVISDPYSGDVLWTGAVAREGIQQSAQGSTTTVRCVGNTDDMYGTRHWSLPYICRDYGEWEREAILWRSHQNWDTATGARPVDPPWDSLLISIREGVNIYPGWGGRMAYLGHMGSDMWIGSFRGIVDSGTAQHPNKAQWGGPDYLSWKVEYGNWYWGVDIEQAFDTTAKTVRMHADNGAWWPAQLNPHTNPPRDVSDSNYLVVATKFNDSAGFEVTNENVWLAASYVVVTGQRVDRYGANIPGSAVTNDEIDGLIRAGQIVEDLVGRCLRGVVDPTQTSVRMETWRLTQADYREPTTPGEIMDDLRLVHTDHLWRLGKRSLTTGLASLEWRLWDTTPRYVIDAADAEVDLDGGSDPLYNSVTVQWIDWKKRPRSASFRADPKVYPDIADLQGIREGPPIVLNASLGEWETVKRVGERMLDQVARRNTAGTITVTRPVLDLYSQQRVPPAQIEAGSTLVLSSDQFSEVHRVQGVDHPSVEEADITVGRPRLTLDQIVATRGRRRR